MKTKLIEEKFWKYLDICVKWFTIISLFYILLLSYGK